MQTEATKAAEIGNLVHELADAAVNWGGYADDAEDSDRRRAARDALEIKLYAALGEANQ